LLIIAIARSLALASAQEDNRFQWSAKKFASQCGFKSPGHGKVHFELFTDHDYSDKWAAITPEKYKNCEDCYRIAEISNVDGVRLVQFTLNNESGDWMHYTSYCFNSAGKLQAVSTDFNCAWGWSYVRVYAYSSNTLTLLDERWQDLKSGSKIAQPDTASEMKDHWSELPVYKTISELPFAKLIRN
jgi:hypothetical protein